MSMKPFLAGALHDIWDNETSSI